eukprot:UN10479
MSITKTEEGEKKKQSFECVKCKEPLQFRWRGCPMCLHPVPVVCTSCLNPISLTFKFCAQCGKKTHDTWKQMQYWRVLMEPLNDRINLRL